jgi:hypothetical protein
MMKDRHVEVVASLLFYDGDDITEEDLDILMSEIRQGNTLTIETIMESITIRIEKEIER